jgi:two-component system CheB/CheR fusion protein
MSTPVPVRHLKKQYIPSAEFYSQIIDSLQDYSIFTLDTAFVINSWSAGAVNIFGYEAEEAIGKSFEIIFTEEDKKKGIPANEIELSLKDGRATDNRWHICKDGSLFYAYGLVFPLLGVEGEMLGYVKILRDLTGIKKSEDAIKNYVKEMEALNTHKDSVLAILSHDLRSPLGGIISATAYLRDNFEEMSKDEIKHMLDLVHTSSVNELNMLDYLLEWARIKYASEAFTPTELQLSDHIKTVFGLLNEAAALNAVNLHTEVEENEAVFADVKMLLSVLQNIVSNAIKHTGPGGQVTISAKTIDEKIVVQIKDSGVGMSKEILDQLFTPQTNVLSLARKENKGAGIGLLLVKGFLQKNGGEIWVESTEGVGSSFYFTLPVKKKEVIRN